MYNLKGHAMHDYIPGSSPRQGLSLQSCKGNSTDTRALMLSGPHDQCMDRMHTVQSCMQTKQISRSYVIVEQSIINERTKNQ